MLPFSSTQRSYSESLCPTGEKARHKKLQKAQNGCKGVTEATWDVGGGCQGGLFWILHVDINVEPE